jgi:hypothetical protein
MLWLFSNAEANKNIFKTPEYDFRDQINLEFIHSLPYLKILNPYQSIIMKEKLKFNNIRYKVQSIAMCNV